MFRLCSALLLTLPLVIVGCTTETTTAPGPAPGTGAAPVGGGSTVDPAAPAVNNDLPPVAEEPAPVETP